MADWLLVSCNLAIGVRGAASCLEGTAPLERNRADMNQTGRWKCHLVRPPGLSPDGAIIPRLFSRSGKDGTLRRALCSPRLSGMTKLGRSGQMSMWSQTNNYFARSLPRDKDWFVTEDCSCHAVAVTYHSVHDSQLAFPVS